MDQRITKQARRWVVRLVRVGVVAYLGLCLAAYLGQNWIAFPGAAFQGKPETAIHFGPDVEVVHLTATDGTPLVAVFGSARGADGSTLPAARRGTVLYFYGNGGSVAWSQGEFDRFRRLGVNVLVPDLPGYGASGGTASEKHFYAAADASWDYLLGRPDVDRRRIVVVGWSLGGAIATDLASRRPVAGLATFNAFTTMPEMGHQLLPWLPTWIGRYQFDNQRKIAGVTCPTLIVNGLRDTLVPAWMSDRLATAAAGPVTRVRIDTADHNSIFTAEPEKVWGAMGRWLDVVVGDEADPKKGKLPGGRR